MHDTTTTRDIVAKLWNLCHILRDDGVTYQDYVTELTYLLFIKMLEETGKEQLLPEGYRWADLDRLEGEQQLSHYKRMLLDLGDPDNANVRSPQVRSIFVDAQTSLRKPTNLKALTDAIDQLDWFSAREEGLGNLYEGLLEKNAAEKKSGAGQYFTPRPLIDCIVQLMKPRPGEVIQDPAAGTGGFLVAADHYIKKFTDDLYQLSEEDQHFQRTQAYRGLELVPDTHRLCLMNLMLHGIEGTVECGDTLSADGEALGKVDLVITNPPFGNKRGGGRPTRNDFSVTADTSNKQLAFVEHVYRALRPGGRAAVVVPDNVLFEENTGKRLRQQLMELCNVHTILRLPTGIFYAQGVKTNVLFFTRGKSNTQNTKKIWIYDMRTNMGAFGKNRALSETDFAEFFKCYGEHHSENSARKDLGELSRFRVFSRQWIAERDDNLDILWLADEDNFDSTLEQPEPIAHAIAQKLRDCLEEIEAFSLQLKAPEQVHNQHSTLTETRSLEYQHSIALLLKRLRQSVFAAAFTGKLTEKWRQHATLTPVEQLLQTIEIPPRPSRFASRTTRIIDGDYALAVGNPGRAVAPGWHWVLLVDVARMESGHTPSRAHPEYWGGNVPWIGIADAREGHGKRIFETFQYTNETGLANSASRLLPAGTVCLSRTASVGYVVQMGIPMATSQDFANWTCTDALDPTWLQYLLMAENQSLYRFGKGTTHTTIYFPELMSLHISLPSIEEQNEIVRMIQLLLAKIDSLEWKLQANPTEPHMRTETGLTAALTE